MKSFLEPEKLFKFLMWGVALLFAWFLIGFGGLIIQDLPHADKPITLKQFDTAAMNQLTQKNKLIQTQQTKQNNQREILNQTLKAAANTYNAEHSNFENWLSTRTATESSNQNPELIKRTQKLEQLKDQEQKIQAQIEELDAKSVLLSQSLTQNIDQLNELQVKSNALYEKALFKQDLKIFGLRLLFVLPLLIIAGWLFVRQRKSKYWPFVWGFIYFALFSFFVELVPYLPSYGGYVRYVVGLILVFVAGSYGIRWMQNYLLQRKLEEQASETIRRQKLDNSIAIKKIGAQVCPSCERHIQESQGVVTNFCMHCGLMLYKPCLKCGTRHNAFFIFCPTCGKNETSESHEEPAK